MRRRHMLVRLVAVATVVTAGLGIGFSVSDAEAGPACGFVKAKKSGTTTMVTLLDYCQVDSCNGEQGFGHWQPPIGAGGVTVEAWACVVVI